MPSELDKSYELVGRILAHLIESGLRKASISPEDFGLEEGEGHLFLDLVDFLKQEGLIRTGSDQYDMSVHGVQLTSRGIAAVEDKRFDNGKSVRATLDEARGGTSGKTYSKFGSFVGGLIGGVTTFLG